MKKLLAILCFGVFAMGSAHAEYSVGLSGVAGFIDATGKETINGGIKADDTGSEKSDELGIGYISAFAEYHLGDNFRVGVSYVPYALESETTENVRNDNCNHGAACSETSNKVSVDLEDLTTWYVSAHKDMFFIKAGMINGDLITNDSLATGSKYGDATLEGAFVGVGVDRELDNDVFVRAEASFTKYENIKLNSTGSDNTNTITISDMDGSNLTLSVGKTF